MSSSLNETHDPRARSWLDAANQVDCDFPLQNLPFAIFRRAGAAEQFRGGVAIGDQILDLAQVARIRGFDGPVMQGLQAASGTTLNALMALGADTALALRRSLFSALRTGSNLEGAMRRCLLAQSEAEYSLPALIGDYTDFYTSIHHASAVGRMMRPDNPLLPNYTWIPIGYHGRSSSIGVSGQTFRRPQGQRLPPGADRPLLGPTQRLDYELELGIFIGRGNERGAPIAMADAESHIFGLCLLNDWSARDIQAWEYQPLGPFLAKNFATTISPWVVTLQALEPFRTSLDRGQGAGPLAYLDSPANTESGAFDIRMEASLQSDRMRERGEPAHRLSTTSYRHAYWTAAQLIVHHTVNGCDLRSGDLLGTGTQSGPEPAQAGSLLELTSGGKQPLQIAPGESRTFLQDGDRVTLRAWCEKPGAARVGFGSASGLVLPAS
jgi:fumarylacetoacetase